MPCCCYQKGMTTFLPTSTALLDVAQLLELDPNDPAVVAAFDELVLQGHLRPWLEGRWELSPELAAGVLASSRGLGSMP